MEKVLCPDKLVYVAESTNAEKEFKHWQRTFENYLSLSGTLNDDDKYKILVKYVSADVYDYFADEKQYKQAMSLLEGLYIKKKNVIFARHQLATRRQQVSESIDEYLQVLHRLSRKCELKDVTAEKYREELVRDSFINGILSTPIRQRLLENQNSSLAEIFDQALSLETAQKSAESYEHRNLIPTTVASLSQTIQPCESSLDQAPESNTLAASSSTGRVGRTCFFAVELFTNEYIVRLLMLNVENVERLAIISKLVGVISVRQM